MPKLPFMPNDLLTLSLSFLSSLSNIFEKSKSTSIIRSPFLLTLSVVVCDAVGVESASAASVCTAGAVTTVESVASS